MAVRIKNIYKPRYSIALLSKTDVWINKTSRLRGFFNIRGRKLHRRGYFKRLVLVLNDMKWTIARRFFQPRLKRKRRSQHRKYKFRFYTKQQIRAFYGIYKEETFRNLFKYFLGGAQKNRSLFFCALESRLDVLLYRLRFLPTIYASRQFIRYCGLRVNRIRNNIPATRVNPGDIVQFTRRYWFTFYQTFLYRIYWRNYGLSVFQHRQFKKIRKRLWWVNKNRLFYKRSLFFLARQKRLLWKFFQIVRNIRNFVIEFKKVLTTLKTEVINSSFNLNPILLPMINSSATSRFKNKITKKSDVKEYLTSRSWQHFVLSNEILNKKELETFDLQISKVKATMAQQLDYFILNTVDNFNLTWADFRNKVLLVLNSLKTRKNIMTHSKFRKFSSITKKRFFRFKRWKRNKRTWKKWGWKKQVKSVRRVSLNVFGKKSIKSNRKSLELSRNVAKARNLLWVWFWKARHSGLRLNSLNRTRHQPMFKVQKIKNMRTSVNFKDSVLKKYNKVISSIRKIQRIKIKSKKNIFYLNSKILVRLKNFSSLNRLFVNKFKLENKLSNISFSSKKKDLKKVSKKVLRVLSWFNYINLLGIRKTHKVIKAQNKNNKGSVVSLKKRWFIWTRKKNQVINPTNFDIKVKLSNNNKSYKVKDVTYMKVNSETINNNIKPKGESNKYITSKFKNLDKIKVEKELISKIKVLQDDIIPIKTRKLAPKVLKIFKESLLKVRKGEISAGRGLQKVLNAIKKINLLAKSSTKGTNKKKASGLKISKDNISATSSVNSSLDAKTNRWTKWKTKKRVFIAKKNNIKNTKNISTNKNFWLKKNKRKVFLRWRWDRKRRQRFIVKKIWGFRRVHSLLKRRLRWKFAKLFKKLTKKMTKQNSQNLTSLRKKFFSVIENRKKQTPWKYSVLTFVSHTNLIFKAYRFLYFYLDLFFELESNFYNQVLIFLSKIREVEITLFKPIYLKVYSHCFTSKSEQVNRFVNYSQSTLSLESFYKTLTH